MLRKYVSLCVCICMYVCMWACVCVRGGGRFHSYASNEFASENPIERG